jgi:hypothetical protein
LDFLKKFPDEPWKWHTLGSNRNFTIDFLKEFPDKPWDWNNISKNPNITMEIIELFPDKPWNWIQLSFNSFPLDKKKFNCQNNCKKIKLELIENVLSPDNLNKHLAKGYSIDEWCT